MELRVPHVTSYARAPSSLSFLRSARYPQMPRFLQFLREFWPMPLPLMIHSALALFAQRTRIPTSARSIGFCVIWVCISSSSSSSSHISGVQGTPCGIQRGLPARYEAGCLCAVPLSLSARSPQANFTGYGPRAPAPARRRGHSV